MAHTPVLALVVDNSGRFPPTEQFDVRDDPKRFARLLEAVLNVHAVGEPPHRPPVADAARAKPKRVGRRSRAAKLVDDLVNRPNDVHTPQYGSSRLKMSSPLKHEKIQEAKSGNISAMVLPAKSLAPANPRGVPAIAERLLQLRIALDMTQSEFCQVAGIAANTYNQWERGKGRPELDKAMNLCDAFSVTLDWLYRGETAGLPYGIAAKLLSRAS